MKDLCLKCGSCCYKHFYDGERVIKTNEKCEHLSETNICNVYDNRPGWCLTAEKMIMLNLLPKNCGYIQKKKHATCP